MVEDFLCTFDKACYSNIEYAEWSNEMLFKVIDKATILFFDVLTNGQVENKDILLEEIKSPIKDYDYQKIYNKIKSVDTSQELKNLYLNALVLTAQEEGQMIKK